ncbi:MAG: hypothetical protein COA84_15205 [Robiginitomaculum sp.]|nr:MAG: hypothetical protein COA84_15205 [Robiginitomaculum sp.]
MTLLQPIGGNDTAMHVEPERFQLFAAPEIAASPYWQAGVCFLPKCGKRFEPARDWQLYCCKKCEHLGASEFRKWGSKMALPMLLHRQGKYDRDDAGVMALTKAARTYVGQVQTSWLESRKLRANQGEAK